MVKAIRRVQNTLKAPIISLLRVFFHGQIEIVTFVYLGKKGELCTSKNLIALYYCIKKR